jgi:hypothetical protein
MVIIKEVPAEQIQPNNNVTAGAGPAPHVLKQAPQAAEKPQ